MFQSDYLFSTKINYEAQFFMGADEPALKYIKREWWE